VIQANSSDVNQCMEESVEKLEKNPFDHEGDKQHIQKKTTLQPGCNNPAKQP
jgi:hypothetical protein